MSVLQIAAKNDDVSVLEALIGAEADVSALNFYVSNAFM